MFTVTADSENPRGPWGPPTPTTWTWDKVGSLPRHRRFLERLLDAVRSDPRLRFVELCCSVANGRADELSDLDLGLGIADESWIPALADVASLLESLGHVVELLDHAIPEWGTKPHRRFIGLYSDGLVVDLVAMPASSRTGLPVGSVALFDADGRLRTPLAVVVDSVDAAAVREWSVLAWMALLDVDKHIRRGSFWEAAASLEEARSHVWRIWAAGNRVARPSFGLTSVIDAGVDEPAGLGATVAATSLPEVRAAAVALAQVLEQTVSLATSVVGGEPPTAAATFTRARLEAAVIGAAPGRRPAPRGVSLRALSPSDAPSVVAASFDPEIARWTAMPTDLALPAAAAWIERQLHRASEGVLHSFAVTTPQLEFAGYVGVVVTDARSGVGEIFYWLVEEARGRGIGRRALTLVSRYAATRVGLQRLEVLIDPANARSRATAQSCGYRFEGILQRKRVVHGTTRDLALYARLEQGPPVDTRRALAAPSDPGAKR